MANRIVIADTSCLIILTKTGLLHILKDLFEKIQVTSKVVEEFGEPLPAWIEIAIPQNNDKIEQLSRVLDAGEATSIALALETNFVTIIIDEKKGRKIAQELNLTVIGTLGLFLIANQKGILNDLESVFDLLDTHGFRFSTALKSTIITLSKKN